jgi:hypothetical protein
MKKQFDLTGLSVMLAIPVHGDISPESMLAIFDTFQVFADHRIRINLALEVGGTLLEARNRAASGFLAGDATHLMFIDKDVVWKGDDVLRLLALSTVGHDIVVGLYPSRAEPIQFFVRFPKGTTRFPPLDEYECAPIDGTGLGFAMLPRRVVETMSKSAPMVCYKKGDRSIKEVFRFAKDGEEFRGEDIDFYLRAKEAGFQTWACPGIKLGHVGRYIWRAHIEKGEATFTEDAA